MTKLVMTGLGKIDSKMLEEAAWNRLDSGSTGHLQGICRIKLIQLLSKSQSYGHYWNIPLIHSFWTAILKSANFSILFYYDTSCREFLLKHSVNKSLISAIIFELSQKYVKKSTASKIPDCPPDFIELYTRSTNFYCTVQTFFRNLNETPSLIVHISDKNCFTCIAMETIHKCLYRWQGEQYSGRERGMEHSYEGMQNKVSSQKLKVKILLPPCLWRLLRHPYPFLILWTTLLCKHSDCYHWGLTIWQHCVFSSHALS